MSCFGRDVDERGREARVDLGVGVERRLREHHEVVVPVELVGEREVLVGERLVDLLRQRQLLVVALEQREAQVAGGRRLEPGDVGDDDEHEDADEADAASTVARGLATRVRSDEPEVEQRSR